MLKYPDSLRRLIAVAATLTITAILSGGCEITPDTPLENLTVFHEPA